MPENGTPPTPASDDGLARVLQPLLELSFVLTDRDGFVTRWTPRAEAIFGFEGDRVTGHSLLETIGSSEQETPAGGVLDATVHHEGGNEFPVELTFIPVPMSHSLEFNFFLESLESDRPREAVLRRVQSQHSDVLDWIGNIVAGKDVVSEDEMTAGTIVTFRAKVDTPWADLAVSSGGGDAKPRSAAPSPELSNAVARADEMMARSDVLERNVGEATAAVEEARTKADAAHETAAAAASRVAQLDDENSALRGELDGARNELAELRRALESRSGEGIDGEALESLRAELTTLQANAGGEELAALRVELEELGELRKELKQLRKEGSETDREELAALKQEVDELRQSASADKGDGAELEELRRELHELRAQAPAADEIASLKAELETLRTLSSDHERLEHLRAEVAELQAQPAVPDTSAELEELRRELRELRRAPGPDELDVEGLKEELRALREAAPGAADGLELEHLKREVEALRSAEPASEELDDLRRELGELRKSAASGGSDQVAALRNELEALKIDASGRVSSIREELNALRESALSSFGDRQLDELRAEVERLIAEAPAQGADKENLKQLREELSQANARAEEVAERMAELESMGGAAGGADPAAVRKGEQALEAAKAAAADADAARRDADAAKRGAEAADERAEGAAESARRHLAETREGVESASLEAKLARSQAEAARAAADEAARYVEAARELAEAMAGRAETEAAAEDADPAPLLGKKDTGPARPPIPGFDDAGRPMATIELDGKFKELNNGFTELVGYSETDFQAASWPPIADRRQLDHHREQMQAMLDGQLESVEVDTGYVHAQGLLVPVAGTLSLVRDDANEPSHFVLAVNPPSRAAAAA